MVMRNAFPFGSTVMDRLALEDDAAASAAEQDEKARLVLQQRGIRRTQQARMNDPITQLLAKSGAITALPGETPHADENAKFWGNNTRLSQIAGLEGGGVSRPEGAQLLGHVGPTIGGGGGGSYASQPFSSLLNASSKAGGDVTFSPGGNYSRGPAMDDTEIERLKQERIRTQGMQEALPSVAADRARNETAFNMNAGVDEALTRHIGDLNRAEEVRNARQYFQPDVAAVRESKERSATDQFYERYGRPKEIEAGGKIAAEGVKQQGAIDVQASRAETARYVAQINNLQRSAAALPLDDPQRLRLEAVIDYLKQQIGPDAMQVPAGLGVR